MLQNEWTSARNEMIGALVELGHPRELGEEIAKNLESPKAMRRMTAYLRYVKPRKAELVVDEMLAIRSEILSWREKKASEAANEVYNDYLEYGPRQED